MKKIVLLNVYGKKNIGDEAILISALSFINEVLISQHQTARLTAFCEDTGKFNGHNFSSLSISNIQMPYWYALKKTGQLANSMSKVFSFTEIMTISSVLTCVGLAFPNVLPQKGFYSFIKKIKDSDKVIGIGGGYLISKSATKDTFGLGLTLLPIFIAKVYKKEILHLPISFGPFASSLHRYASYLALKNTTVFCREKISYDLLKKMDFTSKSLRMQLFPDLALFLKPPHSQNRKSSHSVILTAREWLPRAKQNIYEKTLATLVDLLWEKYSFKTIFLIMVRNKIEDDDEVVYRRIKSHLIHKKVITFNSPVDYRATQELLLQSKAAICTRMHSAILAFTVDTPFLTVGYGHKGLGFMQSLDLTEWYVDISDVKGKAFTNQVESFLKHNSQLHIKKTIREQKESISIQRSSFSKALTKFL